MQDYVSLREENMTLEQQNCFLLNKQVELEKDLNSSILKNQALQKKLNTTEQKAENSMRWNRSSIILDSLHKSQSSTRHRIGFTEIKNPNIDRLCSHCGLTGHKSHACDKKQISHHKKFSFLRKNQKKSDPEHVSTSKVLPRWAKKFSYITLITNRHLSGFGYQN